LRRRKELTNEQFENMGFLVLITVLALLCRFLLFPFESGDYHQFLQGWYTALKENGGFAAVGMNIGDYMPTYLYLLAGFTYLPVSGLTAIKLVSSLADIVLAVYVMKTVRLKVDDPLYGGMAYAAVLFLPSVVLNSAVWGQCDAIFTAALVACVYYFMLDKEYQAVAAFAIAFVFKLQAVFLAPFLLLLLVKRRVRLSTFLMIPFVYLLAILPAMFLGRSMRGLLTVYFSQAGQYKMIAMFLPNLYTWLPEDTPEYISAAAVILAGALTISALFYLYKRKFVFTDELFVSLALFFALLLPFILPHMHERYFYLADILSVVFAFYFPKMLYVPVVTVLSSTYAVCHNLFNTDFFSVQLLAVIMLFILIQVARHTVRQIDLQSEQPGQVPG
jgi:Predicted integral membrane protein